MPIVSLSPAQRASLKALAHPLSPILRVGAAGVTPAFEREVDRALTLHGLIKVRLSGAERTDRQTMATTLSTQLDCAIVQQVGHIAVLFREPAPDRHGEPGVVTLLPVAPKPPAPARGARRADGGTGAAGSTNAKAATKAAPGTRPAARSGAAADDGRRGDPAERPRRISRGRIAATARSVTPRSGSFLVSADGGRRPAAARPASGRTGGQGGPGGRAPGRSSDAKPAGRRTGSATPARSSDAPPAGRRSDANAPARRTDARPAGRRADADAPARRTDAKPAGRRTDTKPAGPAGARVPGRSAPRSGGAAPARPARGKPPRR